MPVADQQAIVAKHNDLRRKVAKGQETQGNPGPQPAAANMREMSWDAELAQAAQKLTDRCVFAHEQNRKTRKLFAVKKTILKCIVNLIKNKRTVSIRKMAVLWTEFGDGQRPKEMGRDDANVVRRSIPVQQRYGAEIHVRLVIPYNRRKIV